MICPNCSNENREGAKFCDECGARLPFVDEVSVVDEPELSEAACQDASTGDCPPDAGETSAESPSTEAQHAETDHSDEMDVLPCERESGNGGEATVEPEASVESEGLRAGDGEHDALSSEEPIMPAEMLGAGPEETAPIMSPNLAGFDRPSQGYGELIPEDAQFAHLRFRDGSTMEMPIVEDQSEAEQAPQSKDFISTSTVSKKGHGKRIAIGLVVIAALCGIAALATYQMELWGGKVIPDVTNMTEADARAMLTDAGFTVKTREIKSDDTEGLVVLSDPSAGLREQEGTEVVIHIASSREIPDIIGKTKSEAKKALKAEGYENVKFKKEKSDNEKGTVISTAPKAGEACKSTAKVVVKLATPYTVPDVAGLDRDSAGQAIIDEGLAYDFEEVETEDYVDGAIMGTVPEAGAEVKKDSLVMIQVARVRGPELESLTIDHFEVGSDVSIGMVDYIVDSVETVEYVGNDTVNYVITARPYTHLLGQKLIGSKRRVEGSIVWTPDNKISEIN